MILILRLMMLSLILSLVLQTTTVSIKPNTPWSLEFYHNGQDSSQYRLWCDGIIVKNYSDAEISNGKSSTVNIDGNFTYDLTAPGLSSGKHSCLISAYNLNGEVKGDPIDIPIGNLPMKPSAIKVVVK